MQVNYCTWEHELLGVLEALLQWEDKLLGLQFTVVTDHQALTFFNEAPTRSQRRMHWWEYLSRFNFKMQYLKGEKNKVVDCLSCYFASDEPGEVHNVSVYVNADSRLDPEGDDLPTFQQQEIQSLATLIAVPNRNTGKAIDRSEARQQEAKDLVENKEIEQDIYIPLNLKDASIQDVLDSVKKSYIGQVLCKNLSES